MKSLIALVAELLADAGSACSVEVERDLISIKSRVEHEGISFLTITLPSFAEDFERCLDKGSVDSTSFVGWKKKGCLPKFLWGFTSLVFDKQGRLRDEVDILSIHSVRQICKAFKKVLIPCHPTRIEKAKEKYLQLEQSLGDARIDNDRYNHFLDCADIIWSDVVESEFNTFGLVPKHGPGATAERISGNRKYAISNWHERLEEVFPCTEFAFTSVNHVTHTEHSLENLTMLRRGNETPVRVITVPKTLKGPRIIAIEPVCMQYTQQALTEYLVKRIERCALTKRSVRFTDQTVNQRLAMTSSRDGSMATIDLSDASDRVLAACVYDMLRSVPDFRDALFACRSETASLDGVVIHLKKFASMGSATCFPIEAMYFFSIIVHSLLWKAGRPPTRRDIEYISKRVNVYGDDIIVPVNETDIVLEGLCSFNCKVNTNKSFWSGKFRESCGTDAYDGTDITPVYVRDLQPSSKRETAGLLSWIATSNLFHKNGYWRTASYMKHSVEAILGELPCVSETCSGLGWYSFCGVGPLTKMCKHLHRERVLTYVTRQRRMKDPLDGYPALLKYFLKREAPDIASADKKHLESRARLGTVSRKRLWVLAH